MSQLQPDKLLTAVLQAFGYAIEDCNIALLGNGLINKTYLVKADDKRFVLQRINQQVFKQPLAVINNADLISRHLNIKHQQQLYPLKPIWQLGSQDNKSYVKVQGHYWRSLNYIPNCYTLEAMTNTEQAQQVAGAFAQFTGALNDFNSEQLTEIIPQFHDLSMRVNHLNKAMSNTKAPLLLAAQETISFILSQQTFIAEVADITEILPKRVTHNDTKINNLLFSHETNKAIAVIDLDTCMPGYIMHDFGDMVRSCCASIAEDSEKIDDMSIDIDLLKALSQAYIAGFNGDLSNIEHASLLVGIKLMPFMLSIRFLTDFLQGDNYFKVNYPSHNLVRAKNQLQLYKLFCQQESLLNNIILKA